MHQDFQTELILNSLPFPQNYNGLTWNSKIGRTRKNMPEYLRSDLPPLQYTYIREQFKQLDKIQCPRLAYFKNKIIPKKIKHPDPPPASRRLSPIINHQMKPIRLQKQLANIRDEMKYALILTDRKSNIITELIDRANTLEQQRDYKSQRKAKLNSRRGHSLRSIKQEDKCFPDTLELVLTARIQKSSAVGRPQDYASLAAEQKIQAIKLLPLDQENPF